MPIYEYTCMKCNKNFEYLVLGSDNSVACPECHGNKVKRQMSTCSFKSDGNYSSSSGGSSGCATCSSSSCATCH